MSTQKEKFELEYIIKTSPSILFTRLANPSGLSEWFADDVNLKGKVYTFVWDQSEQQAEQVLRKENKMVRYHWLEDEDADQADAEVAPPAVAEAGAAQEESGQRSRQRADDEPCGDGGPGQRHGVSLAQALLVEDLDAADLPDAVHRSDGDAGVVPVAAVVAVTEVGHRAADRPHRVGDETPLLEQRIGDIPRDR